jgi:hypothetical protein
VGKKAAEAEFRRIEKLGKVTFDAIMRGLDLYIAHKPDWQKFCDPIRWLKGERWNDEYPGAPSATSAIGGEQQIDFGGGYMASASTIKRALEQGKWFDNWGPRPGEPGCLVPPWMLAELNATHTGA